MPNFLYSKWWDGQMCFQEVYLQKIAQNGNENPTEKQKGMVIDDLCGRSRLSSAPFRRWGKIPDKNVTYSGGTLAAHGVYGSGNSIQRPKIF